MEKSGRELGAFLDTRLPGALALLLVLLLIWFGGQSLKLSRLLKTIEPAGVYALRALRQPDPVEEGFVAIVERLRRSAEEPSGE